MFCYPESRLLRYGAASFFIVFALACISCITEKDDYREFGTAPLFGMVYDRDNQPCSNVHISVDGEERSISDINGRFIIAKLSKGSHTVSAYKERYEPLEISLDFLNKSQVLYLQIISFDQLLAKAEQSLERRDYLATEAALERARTLVSDDPVLHYLSAVLLRKTSEYQRAVDQLEDMLDRGNRNPAVYILLADILQYDMEDYEAAREYLGLLLEIRPEKSIEQRIEEIAQSEAE